jgi:hypothetical protein
LKGSDQIRPFDANGQPSAEGKIGLITIDFSNASIESEDFKRAADADPQKSPRVVIVNGAVGSRSAVMWAWDGDAVLPQAEQERLDKEMDVLQMPKTNRNSMIGLDKDTWRILARRIEAAALSPKQVQVWLKQVEAIPKPLGEFPAHTRALQTDITATHQGIAPSHPVTTIGATTSHHPARAIPIGDGQAGPFPRHVVAARAVCKAPKVDLANESRFHSAPFQRLPANRATGPRFHSTPFHRLTSPKTGAPAT